MPSDFHGQVRTGDLLDRDYLDTLLKGVDVVVHAAAWTSLWNHKKQSEELFLKPSLELIDSARRHGVKRFVFISTTSAADRNKASDPMSKGVKRAYWPHEANVVAIEDALRAAADENFCAVNLRLGLFAGSRYALGLLPILVPRLKTHLVPWVAGGHTRLPIMDGRDIGACSALAATAGGLKEYEGFNVVGAEIPTVRDVINYLNEKYQLPRPHFSVPFPVAFLFAWLMEQLDPIVPWEPLVTRSIIHLLQDAELDNHRATERLGYLPKYHWKQAVDLQLAEMAVLQKSPMSMARPISGGRES
jgi:nucleoside-diphosphate-sugar epimerase